MPSRSNSQTLTVEAILNGTSFGQTQSAGQMEVIPILDDGAASDNEWAPPISRVSVSNYGTVRARNADSERPTIMPMGSGFISPEAVQDHAVLSAKFIGAGKTREITGQCCIQQSQPGLMQESDEKQRMVILPAPLRIRALSLRKETEYSRMWQHITTFNQSMGLRVNAGNVADYLQAFDKELNEFVAEFEVVPRQIGAVVLIHGQVVGVERTPNTEFFQSLFAPLIRGCYGALAIKAARLLGNKRPPTRTTLDVREKTLAGLAIALRAARAESERLVTDRVEAVKKTPLLLSGAADEKLSNAELLTVANTTLAGQIVVKGSNMPYVSLVASGA